MGAAGDNEGDVIESTTIVGDSERVPRHGAHAEAIAFVIAWCPAHAQRIGEVALGDAIRAALERHNGRVAEAARTLGLSSRYALYRLMKKHGIDADALDS